MSTPTGRLVVENVAPPDELGLLLPSRVVPVKKLTVPRGEPLGTGVTVATSVTVWPKKAGFGPALRAVEVGVGGLPIRATVLERLEA